MTVTEAKDRFGGYVNEARQRFAFPSKIWSMDYMRTIRSMDSVDQSLDHKEAMMQIVDSRLIEFNAILSRLSLQEARERRLTAVEDISRNLFVGETESARYVFGYAVQQLLFGAVGNDPRINPILFEITRERTRGNKKGSIERVRKILDDFRQPIAA